MMTKEQVKRWQLMLTSLGISPGPIDGGFGPLTEAATEELQTVLKVPVTGGVDAPTKLHLMIHIQNMNVLLWDILNAKQ